MAKEDKKINNPNNLPIIEENSLHRIVTTVKLYQEFKQLGREKFEEIYGKKDAEYQKTLEGVCYKKYYKKGELGNGEFSLMKDKKTGQNREIGDYLKVETDENDRITQIQSKKPFYWGEWDFRQDIERKDWSKGVEKDKNYKIIGNFIPDECQKNPENEGKPFVVYDFSINLLCILIVNVTNRNNIRLYFENQINFFGTIFKKQACFSYSTFKYKAIFVEIIFEDEAYFVDTIFEDEAYFPKSTFKKLTSFWCATFENKSIFTYSIFEDKAYFVDAIFEDEAYFVDTIFETEVFFNSIIFQDKANFVGAVFKKQVNFESSTFKHKVYFFNTIFEKAAIFDKINFGDQTEPSINFFNINANKDFILKPDISLSQNLTIHLERGRFENRLDFSLVNDDLYKNVTLILKDISYTDFICEDKNLYQTKLWYTENQKDRQKFIKEKLKCKELQNTDDEEKKELRIQDDIKFSDTTEQAIAERRVFRKILQDLNWGDKADEEYAKIMDLQLDLDFQEKGLNFANLWKILVYQKIFGWGVRMQNIVWTSIIFVGGFTFIYAIYDYVDVPFANQNLPKVAQTDSWFDVIRYIRFSVWNSFLLSDIRDDLGWIITLVSTIQGVLGIVYVTVLVAIISRKFMRM